MRFLPNWAIWAIIVASILLSPAISMFLVFIAGEAAIDAGEALVDFLADADVPVRLAVLLAGLAIVVFFRAVRLRSPLDPQAWAGIRTAAGRWGQ